MDSCTRTTGGQMPPDDQFLQEAASELMSVRKTVMRLLQADDPPAPR